MSCATTSGIERRAATGDAPQCVHEFRDVADAILEQVADTAPTSASSSRRVLPLDVLAQHEDRRARHATARLDRGLEALVALRRRHPDVDDGHVGPVLHDGRDEGVAVADLGHDRPARLLDEPRDALADERGILGDDHAEGVGRWMTGGHARAASPAGPSNVMTTLPFAWPSSTHFSASTTWSSGKRRSMAGRT